MATYYIRRSVEYTFTAKNDSKAVDKVNSLTVSDLDNLDENSSEFILFNEDWEEVTF